MELITSSVTLPLWSISPSVDTSLTETIAYATSSAVTWSHFFITASYSCILAAILKNSIWQSPAKGLSTCSSHLTVVMVFYGTLIATYLVPSANSSQFLRRFSLLYTILTPMFNPIIYSLRNRDIHEALKKCLSKKPGFLRWCKGKQLYLSNSLLTGLSNLVPTWRYKCFQINNYQRLMIRHPWVELRPLLNSESLRWAGILGMV